MWSTIDPEDLENITILVQSTVLKVDSRMSYRGKFVPQIALSSGWNNNHKDKIANLQLGTYWKGY